MFFTAVWARWIDSIDLAFCTHYFFHLPCINPFILWFYHTILSLKIQESYSISQCFHFENPQRKTIYTNRINIVFIICIGRETSLSPLHPIKTLYLNGSLRRYPHIIVLHLQSLRSRIFHTPP